MKAGQEASFAVQLNGARGLVDAKVHSPSGATEECYVSELDSGEMVSSVQSGQQQLQLFKLPLQLEFHQADGWSHDLSVLY